MHGQRESLTPTKLKINLVQLVSYECVKTFKSINISIFKLEFGNQNADGQMHRQINEPTGTNIESNVALVLCYHPVHFQSDQQKHLQVKVEKQNINMADMLFFKMTSIFKVSLHVSCPSTQIHNGYGGASLR